ncbi:reverse transcriptase domain-containing protein [Roseomonas mucosa]|uniref:reverse transcriptase domain-containing protein n=1 Tax=Roseomonas mucosa TaxID=207340 RepID=UPI00384B3128
MQANTVQKRLASLPSLSEAGKRVNGLARLLASRTLMEASVNRTRLNRGSTTPGVDGETLDGLTIGRINGWVRSMVEGSYSAQPVKRVFIPKANGKLRPLGIPTYADRMVQNAQREILERIYEPVFSDHSHGFRPRRSCHTALMYVRRVWAATKWFVEVDIKGFFDNIDHDVLLDLLRTKIDDEAFVATIRAQLQAGVMENLSAKRKGKWRHQPSYSGTPQGGIVSPMLANIYLHELDKFMEGESDTFNRGKRRRLNPEYNRISTRISYLRAKVKRLNGGDDATERERLITEIWELTKTMRTMPSMDPMDPDYRRLRYVRYADDFLIGVIGSKADAVAVLERVRAFLRNTLHLDVSPEKTGIVKATDGARFLGYDVLTRDGARIAKIERGGFVGTKRCSSERLVLSVPREKLLAFCNKHGYGDYLRAKGRHRGALIHSSDYEIVSIYAAELRGLANYYRLDAWVKTRLNQLAWVANQSLFKTLAGKHKTSVRRMVQKLRRGNGRYVARHEAPNGKTLEVAVWRTTDIKEVGLPAPPAGVDKTPVGAMLATGRTDVTARLLAGECENKLCISPPDTPLQVHHVNALANVGRSSFLEWLERARNRKTRYLCVHCHPLVRTNSRRRTVRYADGEPDDGKLSRPVLGGGAMRSART